MSCHDDVMAIKRTSRQVRIPDDIDSDMAVSVDDQKKTDPKYSINDFIVQAIFEKLNRGTLPSDVSDVLKAMSTQPELSKIASPEFIKAVSGIPVPFPRLQRGDILSIPGTLVVNPPTEFVVKEDIKEVDGELTAELAEDLERGEFTVVEEMSREEFERRYPQPEVEWPDEPTANLDQSAVQAVNAHLRSLGIEPPADDEIHVEAPLTRPWLPELEKIAAMLGNDDAGSAYEYWGSLVSESKMLAKGSKLVTWANKAEMVRAAKDLDKKHPLGVK